MFRPHESSGQTIHQTLRSVQVREGGRHGGSAGPTSWRSSRVPTRRSTRRVTPPGGEGPAQDLCALKCTDTSRQKVLWHLPRFCGICHAFLWHLPRFFYKKKDDEGSERIGGESGARRGPRDGSWWRRFRGSVRLSDEPGGSFVGAVAGRGQGPRGGRRYGDGPGAGVGAGWGRAQQQRHHRRHRCVGAGRGRTPRNRYHHLDGRRRGVCFGVGGKSPWVP